MEGRESKRLRIFPLLIIILSIVSLLTIYSSTLCAEQRPGGSSNEVETVAQLEELEGEEGFFGIPPEEQPEAIEEAPIAPVPPKAERKPPPGEVSFFFDDADVFEVIQTIFGEVLKVNYIIDPKVKGRVNFRTTIPIPVDQILLIIEIVLRLNGIAVVEERGLYTILSIGDVPREPAPIRFGRDPEAVELRGFAIIQVVQLQYIDSSEIVNILTPFLSQGGSIFDVPPNFVIIADTDANIKRLLQVVEVFDSEELRLARPQVFVYPVQNSKAADVAALLQQIFLGETTVKRPKTTPTEPMPRTTPTPTRPQPSVGAVGGEALVSEITRIFADEVTNIVIILATPEDFATIAETIKKIDIVPRQVMIEALIARVDLTDKLNFGIQWTIQNDFTISGVKPFEKDINISGPLDLLTGIESSTFTFTAIDAAGNIKLLLQSLASEGKAKILASPHILVSDNREARIQVGSQIPLATQTITTPIEAATTAVTSSVQYKDIGIILSVKPQVNESGLVSLEISQEISSRGEKVVIAGQEFEAINKTEATTNLVAQDGQTIIIGGLIREDITQSRAGIPFLSQIPILGYLFGNTIDETTRNELIILLTPHVMLSPEEAKDVTSGYVDRFTTETKIEREQLIKEKEEEQKEELPFEPSLP